MIENFSIVTSSRTQFIDVTSRVAEIVEKSNLEEGICWIFVPHTTAAVTINEGADPSVARDILEHLDRMIPQQESYHHLEGNSPAHIKSFLTGSSQVIIIQKGKLLLGTWQSIYFCEFDGPRHRQVIVKIG